MSSDGLSLQAVERVATARGRSSRCWKRRRVVIQAAKVRMSRRVIGASYALALDSVVVAVDLLFFSHRFWERLAANIGIVLVFGAFYFRFRNSR